MERVAEHINNTESAGGSSTAVSRYATPTELSMSSSFICGFIRVVLLDEGFQVGKKKCKGFFSATPLILSGGANIHQKTASLVVFCGVNKLF